MRRLLLLAFVVLMPALLSAQTFIYQDFSGSFPPSGWVADSHPTNWHSGASNNAGGTAPEAVFDWSPNFIGISRFMSPRVDLTGVTVLKVQFSYAVDHYASPYTIGVATRHGTGAWTNVWQLSPNDMVDPTILTVNITNGDVGASDFQICWFFNGDSYNINYWYFDDIRLFSPLEHDVKVASVDIDPQYDPSAVIVPRATVENFGMNNETFDATFTILRGQDNLYSQTVTGINLPPGNTIPINFPNFTIPDANQLYDAIANVHLTGDQDTTNDTLHKGFNTYTTPRDMVVLEIGTGTWCTYCPGAAMGADDLIENGFNVAVVEYHSGGGGDPFINTYSDARVAYYGITGFPTAVFDGVQKFIGGDHNISMYPYYLPIYDTRAPIKSAFSIEIFGDHVGNVYDVDVIVTKHAPILYQNMALIFALTESDIAYNWQGQTHVNFAERLMAPDENGTILNFSGGDVQQVSLSFTVNPTWVADTCEIVTFVQNLDDKEVLQGTKIMLHSLTPLAVDDEVALPTETKLLGNYPNPFNPATTIQYSLKESGNVRLEVYNLLGQKVRTIVDGYQSAGSHVASWDSRDSRGNEVASGAYFYRLTTDTYMSTRKMLLTK